MNDAEQACVDIFNDFEKADLSGCIPSIALAWEAGRAITMAAYEEVLEEES